MWRALLLLALGFSWQHQITRYLKYKKENFQKKTFLFKKVLLSVCFDIKNLITALWKKVDCISLCSKLFSFQSWPICVITFVKSIQFASNFLSIMALACWQPRRVLSSLDSTRRGCCCCIMKL